MKKDRQAGRRKERCREREPPDSAGRAHVGTGPEAGLGTLPTRRPRAHSFGLDLDRQPMSREHFRFRTRSRVTATVKALRRRASPREPVEHLPRRRAPLSAAVSPPALLCGSTPGCRQCTRLLASPASSPCPSCRDGRRVLPLAHHIPFLRPHPPRADALQTFPAPPWCTTPLPWPVCVLHGYFPSVNAQRLSSERTQALLRGTRCHRLGRLLLGIKEKMPMNRQHTIEA